jgi:hypothetical protein
MIKKTAKTSSASPKTSCSSSKTGCAQATSQKGSYSSTVMQGLQQKNKQMKTRIVANYDCGFPNTLFIRGEGVSTLSWNKGVPMKNTGSNQWVWESERPFTHCEFKVLVNDNYYEMGENHKINFGQDYSINPQF